MHLFRTVLAAAAAAMLWGAAPAVAAEKLGGAIIEHGMYTQPWFLDSFLELGEDLREANDGGKRFAIIWEQRGCPYCRETHVVNFATPEIRKYVKANFTIVQINIHGDREVTDFDGATMTERDLAKKYGVRYTPTLTFYREPPAAKKPVSGKSLELTRMAGYYRPFHFLAAFRYVRQKGYERQKFGPFVAKWRGEREKKGLPIRFK